MGGEGTRGPEVSYHAGGHWARPACVGPFIWWGEEDWKRTDRGPATGEPEGEDRGVARRDVFPPARMWGWFVLFFFSFSIDVMPCAAWRCGQKWLEASILSRREEICTATA